MTFAEVGGTRLRIFPKMQASIRFATRRLLRAFGFTVGVTVLLAWGIGTGTALLSLVDAISFRPLDVWRPDELVRVVQHHPTLRTTTAFPYEFFEALERRSDNFSFVAGDTEAQAVLSEPAPAQEIRVSFVTSQFFSMLGVPALYGRVLAPSDERDSAETPPVVLSYAFWSTRFRRDPQVLRQTLVLNNHPCIIVGVMPRSFEGFSADTTSDVSVPFRARVLLMTEMGRVSHPILSIVGRLKPGHSRATAEAATLAIWQRAIAQYWADRVSSQGEVARGNLADDLRLGVQLESEERGSSFLRDHYGAGWVLLGASALVLEMLLCANLATIVLSRNAANTNDIAVRLALGASRGNVLRLLICETALLAAIGAVAGILVGYLLIPLLLHVLPSVRDLGTARLTTAVEVGHDARPLIIGLALSLASFLGFGLVPAWIASRMPVREGLQSVHVSHRLDAQRRLLLVQVALCTLLLACASLLTRSFLQLRGTNPGFDAEHLVSFTFDPQLRGYTDDQANRLRERLMAQVQALPGVADVAASQWPVMRGTGIKVLVARPGDHVSPSLPPNVTVDPVSETYFETMGMRIVEGRDLSKNHAPGPDNVVPAVVNQAFARQFFPETNPVGRHFVFVGTLLEGEIAGVVSDSKFRSLRDPPSPAIYEEASNLGRFRSVMYVRTKLRPPALIEPVLKIFAALDPTLPVIDVNTMEEELDATTAGERFNARIAAAFASFAAILAGLSIYGLMALVVTQRQRELAIHLAVGASRSRLVTLVSRQFVFFAAGGVNLGLGAALFAGPLLRNMLYGVTPSDPASLLAPVVAVTIVALLGSLLPLFRALRIEPATALRQLD